MITIFDMASGEAAGIALVEPKVELTGNAPVPSSMPPQVQLRLMTVDEAVALERQQRR
jgi:hypothetical protein